MVGVPYHGLWRAIWQYLAKLRIFILFDIEIPLSGIYSEVYSHTNTYRNTHENVYWSTVHKIKFGEQSKCPLTGEDKHIHLIGNEKNDTKPHISAQLNHRKKC